jgi:hypothetical protein
MKCIIAIGIALFLEISYDRSEQSMFDVVPESFWFEKDRAIG